MQSRGIHHLFDKCDHLDPSCPHTWAMHEERANMVTHSIGIGLSIAALVLLTIQASLYGSALNMISCTIFGITLLLAYSASTLYHSSTDRRVKRVLRMFDHICIYLLIAGTYTPFLLVSLRGTLGLGLFAIIWVLALGGAVFKLFFIEQFPWVSTLVYVAMGWMGLGVIVPIIHALPLACLFWLLAGGLFYTFGVFFFLLETVPFCHTVWHFFVMAGSFCHFVAVYYYVAPMV